MKKKNLKILLVNICILLAFLLLLELTGQVVAMIRPSYDVLFLQPDVHLGWKQVPNFLWTWAGLFWYAADFTVSVQTNPDGFRDVVRDIAKPQGVFRVALLGDSFIEAVQVPLSKTAAQLLEIRLNDSSANYQKYSARWEVLNFGISNYGVGQYLLAWEQYARLYHPDYVAIFVAGFHMKRTLEKNEYGAFPATANEQLWIRPTFRIENGFLRRQPARDFHRFVKVQKDLIEGKFAGNRICRKKIRPLTLYYGSLIWDRLQMLLMRLDQTFDHTVTSLGIDIITAGQLFPVNLQIIDELKRQVRNSGGVLVILDASQYFGDDVIVSKTLRDYCSHHGLGYIPLYEDLMKANIRGVPTQWAHDGHFNEWGNIILAKSLYNWITEN